MTKTLGQPHLKIYHFIILYLQLFNTEMEHVSPLDRREKTGFRFVPFACISFPLATKVWREDVDMVKTLLEAGVTSAAATAAVACT